MTAHIIKTVYVPFTEYYTEMHGVFSTWKKANDAYRLHARPDKRDDPTYGSVREFVIDE